MKRLAHPEGSPGADEPAWRAVPQRTYRTAIYQELSRLISELTLPPGTRLLESELSAKFGVSKTPIREALLLLEGDGLISIMPYHGATVTWMQFAEYEELLFLQDALEQPALQIVSDRITDGELRSIGILIDQLEDARGTRDSLQFHQTAVDMHARLFEVVNSPRLIGFVLSLIAFPCRRYEKVLMHQFDEIWDVELASIRGRYEHLCARNPAAAAKAVEEAHARLLAMAKERLDHPLVKPFIQPTEDPGASRDRLRRRVAAQLPWNAIAGEL